MSLFAIGDLHLALGAPEKNMEVFSGRWTGYVDKIRRGFDLVGAEDTCVICGDFCWAMDLEAALPDFAFLNELPGKKILLKGNHDYWWNTAAKMNAFFRRNGLDTLSLLHNNCVPFEDAAVCGTRGWFYEEETGAAHDAKILRREAGRLETSLRCAGDREKIVFLHYPPIYQHYRCGEIMELLVRYGVRECYYGHIHGNGSRSAFQGEENGVHYRLLSADYLDFYPLKIR
ncbi:MAG: metallophosphoesterase [Oscillospiraceae bacterium]|nr:metallophosphoesterase [Oscillospiraceae bacterium]